MKETVNAKDATIKYQVYSQFFKSVFIIGIMVRVFANGLGDLGSIPGWIIPKTQKMLLDAALLSIQHYKLRIKDKIEQSMEKSSALHNTYV